MKHFALAFLTYLAAVVQAGSPLFVDGGFTLYVLPAVLVLALFLCDGWQAVLWAGIIGLVSDALRTAALGVDMLCAVLLAALIAHRLPRRREWPVIAQLALGGAFAFAFLVLANGLSAVLSRRTVDAGALLSAAAVGALGTLSICFAAVLAFNAVTPLFRLRRRATRS